MKLPFKSRSQSLQDFFAYTIGGKNGTYIEIGGNKPRHKNNTYNLDVDFGWKGFSIEYNKKYKQTWDECKERHNPCYFADALTFDYASKIKELKLPSHITYLSCDIEPAKNTFDALQKVINDGISFDCITFEHDNYAKNRRKEPLDYDVIAREYLIPLGYKVAVENVYVKQNKDAVFETWFVKESIDFNLQQYEDWKFNIQL
jgi:hypothetical protein